MGAIKITENVYAVGVLNPSMRIFDVIMRTEYGTSYNAYILQNNNKTALIETVHVKFFDEYLENIRAVLGDKSPDYLIMNHNEPDHSGAVAKICEIYPDIQIIESKAGAIYLKNIANNNSLKIKTVNDGDKLEDLGVRFINAPFLHWPDSMFTVFEGNNKDNQKENILFTCDFFGAHYCEPTCYDYNMKYPKAYHVAFEYYYHAIFGPFKPYVLAGLEKIKDLKIDYVCTSHGPVLTNKNNSIENAKKIYAELSKPHENLTKQVNIFYCSAYGNTGELAKYIKYGIKQSLSCDCEIYDINEYNFSELAKIMHESDAILFGSPTINRDAVPPVWQLISMIDAISMKDTPCAVFGSYGWSGEACGNLIERLRGLKLKVNAEPFKCQFVPSQEDCEKATDFGKTFGEGLAL